jgi:peptidoglycan/xylan/chitin deacetylase (PgdA/CDA1 family)
MENSEWRFQSLLVFIVALVVLILAGSFLPAIGYSIQMSPTPSGNSSANSKVVMLTFGDTLKSQFTNTKPILDKYGFKASFFITCLWVGSDKSRMTWQDILALQMDGQDIESKTMTHRRMTNLSPNDLNYEVAGSKKCLADHGINATIFATTHGNEWNNALL